MIQILNNFLPKEVFKVLQNYVEHNEFQIVTVGEKDFSVLQTPDFVIPYLQINGFEMTLSFIRQAHKDFDTELNIHCDHIINGQKTVLASVIYLNNDGETSKSGTSFFKHHLHGIKAPDDLTNQEFDRLLLEDSADDTKWEELDHVAAFPNRRLLYESQLFHARFPAKVEFGNRYVLVSFYVKK